MTHTPQYAILALIKDLLQYKADKLWVEGLIGPIEGTYL